MNKSQINHRIAKLCGWKPVKQWYISVDGGKTPLMYFETKKQAAEKLAFAIPCEEHADCPLPQIWCLESKVPNYCECLNSMHQAESTLDEEQWVDYIDWLPREWEAAIHATARERAEAFLKAFGK